MNSRNTAFFILDALKGGRVRWHLDDLRRFAGLGALERQAVVGERLQHLLRHAAATTMHYRAWHGVDDLGSWPVLNKRHIQEDPGRLLSSRYSGKRLAEKRTSGSYGTPMRVLFSRDKLARRNAEVIHFNRMAGLDVGHAYLHVSTDRKTTLHRWLKNTVQLDASHVDDVWLAEAMRVIRSRPGCVMVGFTSVLLALAQYACRSGAAESIQLRAVISAAETLAEPVREAIQKAFHGPVFNRYASTETGVLAFSGGDDDALAVNQASYVVELLALDGDRPVGPGEPGRVVITDLFSYAMPLIRYALGDVAVAGSGAGWGVEHLSRVEGRLVERIFDVEGRNVSWAAIYDVFSEARGVLHYQFIQRAPGVYTVLLVRHGEEALMDSEVWASALKQLLGEKAVVELRWVDSISALPSGKRPMIMNAMTNRPEVNA